MAFATFDDLRASIQNLPEGDERAAQAARARQDTLTKPQGSLGRLEDLAIWLARWQGRTLPRLDTVKIVVFAGSHGVTAQGVSAFPPEVTAQMVGNFANGGAAINQLAKSVGAKLQVLPLDIDEPTGDFTQTAAMDEAAFLAAVQAGYDTVDDDLDLLALGEMGIGNTTPSAAIAAAMFGGELLKWVGRGTGVDDAGLYRKTTAIEKGLALHADKLADPLQAAAALGGRELAAMLGATLAARIKGVPVMIDGFVATSAVAPLFKVNPHALDHALAGHCSAEAGHRALLSALELDPLLHLGMRLGEGSGGALAVNILRGALACHNGMASFAEAAVSDKTSA